MKFFILVCEMKINNLPVDVKIFSFSIEKLHFLEPLDIKVQSSVIKCAHMFEAFSFVEEPQKPLNSQSKMDCEKYCVTTTLP